MEGDDERVKRINKIINRRKDTLVESDYAKEREDHTAQGDLGSLVPVVLGFHNVEEADVAGIIAWIVERGLEALEDVEAPGVIIGTWLDGFQTGMLLAKFRLEDGKGLV